MFVTFLTKGVRTLQKTHNSMRNLHILFILSAIFSLPYSLMAQCTLNGTYNATNFQTAVTNAVNNGCTIITLTGNVSYAGNNNVIIPSSASLVIGSGGSVSIGGNASLSTTNNIEILSGGSFATSGSADLTFVNSPLPNQVLTPGVVNGPITITRLGPLPVELSSFKAHARAGAIEISWSTASELNNERFLIERSGADAVFVSIGEVKGAGTTAEPKEYSFTDRAPLQGANYYRLRQEDYDGKFDHSPVISVQGPKSLTEAMKISPNPVYGRQIRVELTGHIAPLRLELIDAGGRRIPLVFVMLEQTADVVLPYNLTAGVYYLSAVFAEEVLTVPLVMN